MYEFIIYKLYNICVLPFNCHITFAFKILTLECLKDFLFFFKEMDTLKKKYWSTGCGRMNRAIYNIMEGFARLVLKAPNNRCANVVNDVPLFLLLIMPEYTACYYKTVFPSSFTVVIHYNGSQIMC